MTRTVLVLNAGSSSVKFRLFGLDSALPLLAKGSVSGIGSEPFLTAHEEGREEKVEQPLPADSTHEDALGVLLAWVETHKKEWTIAAAGHRVVHGGTEFHGPALVENRVLEKLWALAPLAPLHQPHNLAAIEILGRLKPGLRQVACFDTAFHARHERLFSVYALPREIEDKGVRRYGFHGLSYEWIARALAREHPDIAGGRVIAAHLGNGASLCAIRGGESVDSTMGMTALEGLPMGTRCGSLDPGAILHMIRELGLSVDETEHLLYNDSGLKGLSGISNDVRTLLESPDARARFALDYFILRTAQLMAAMAVSMGGAETIVFTGGIGENAPSLREAIVGRLSGMLSPEILVIPANEERMIALHVMDLL